MNDPKQLLTDRAVAKILGLSVSTVRKWRLTGGGPEFCKIGTSVRYSREAVLVFAASCPRGGGLEIPEDDFAHEA